MILRRFPRIAGGLLALSLASFVNAEPFIIAQDGKPSGPVVVAQTAHPAVRHAAQELAQKLSAMLGQPVEVTVGNGERGIVVGQPGDFPNLNLMTEPVAPGDLAAAQSYVLRSSATRLVVIGASEIGVEFGIWDLLHRLGYRQFFPHEAWEVIPDLSRAEAALELDTLEIPAYFDRRIWYSWGGDADRQREWNFKNRMNQHGWRTDFRPELPARWKRTLIQNQHNYGGIIQFHQATFAEHPEYYALVKDERKGSKLCISNPAVRELAASFARDYFAKHPDELSISMEPTDGYGWCECAACAALGSPANRMITLANHVARALEAEHGDKWIGVLAYAQHAEPPTLAVHDRVIVCCATNLSGKMPIEQRLAGWAQQAKTLGIYDYYAIPQWHVMMPGRMQGGNLEYLSHSIPTFHELGARLMVAEASDCWGPNGLGYYVASRLLWNPQEARQLNHLVDDFLARAFGPAAATMRPWYDLVDNSRNAQTVPAGGAKPGSLAYFADRYARMYAILLTAEEQAQGQPAVRARLDHLLLYTRYVQLWCDHRRSAAAQPGEAAHAAAQRRAVALERLVRFAWRIRDTGMAHWAGFRGVTAGAGNVDLNAPPSWLTRSDQLNLELGGPEALEAQLEAQQQVTPALLKEVRQAARDAAMPARR